MKKIITALFFFCFLISFSQQLRFIDPKMYQDLKDKGQLDPETRYFTIPDNTAKKSNKAVHYSGLKVDSLTTSPCGCTVPLDSTFLVADFTDSYAPQYGPPDYRGDDGSTPVKLLPFNFCFYGTTYTSCYVNRNGNITFGTPSAVFSSTGFPNSTDKMIAPYWTDVDTRDPLSGLVYYKITPNYMIIKWDNVGYYNQHVDKRCTFQLIISNGTDTLIPGNDNVAFCYGNMDWTTGDASSGTNGFGGIAATVGNNKGNGTNFFQIGRFDQPGSAYTGNQNTPPANGVDWLDNRQIFLDACGSGNNIPPVPINGATPGCLPDTFQLCSTGDTLLLNLSFAGPETNQTITITTSAPTLGSNFNVLSTTSSGGVTTTTFMVIGSAAVAGTHLVTITATDNGTPSLSTSISYIVNIPAFSGPPPVLTVNPVPACAGTNPTVTLQSCSSYPDILWSNGSTGCSINVSQTDTVSVTLTSPNGCQLTTFKPVIVYPNPVAAISGPLNFCNSNGTTLVATTTGGTPPIMNYSWTSAGSTNNDSALVLSSGPVTVTVTDANGCTGTKTVTITNNTPPVNISSNFSSFCPGQPVNLTASIANGSYAWSGPGSPFANSQTITVNPVASSTYSVSVSLNGCVSNNTITLNPLATPTVTASAAPYCAGTNTTVSASVSPSGSYTYNWQPGNFSTSSITTNTAGTYTVTASVGTGCPGQTVINVQAPNANPIAAISTAAGPNIICYKGTQTLNSNVISGTPNYSYSWSPAVVPSSPQTASSYTVPNPGTYTLVVTDQNNCVDTTTITLVLIAPSVVVSSPSLICKGDTALLVAQGSSTTPVTYSWMPSLSTNDSIYVTQETNYGVTVTDQYGCTATDVTAVGYYPNPDGAISTNPVSPSVWSQTVTITDASTIPFGTIDHYQWSFGDGSADTTSGPFYHDYAIPGIYDITLITTSNFGCKDTVMFQHEVEVVIPHINIFTPNGDNSNGKLEFSGVQFIKDNQLTIYDRWGKKIYEKKNYDNSWNGDDHPDGTYYYILNLPGYKRDWYVITSFLQLIR
ncbi:MAG: nidogen-like domain-containing protein [Bacteroidia bacterium]